MPVFVWVLEGLASCKAQLRDREEEAERERAEREELLERYQAERTLRKESQEVQRDLVVLFFLHPGQDLTFERCKSRWLRVFQQLLATCDFSETDVDIERYANYVILIML